MKESQSKIKSEAEKELRAYEKLSAKNEEKLKEELKTAKTKAEEIDQKEMKLIQEKQDLQNKVDSEKDIQI